MSSMRAVQISKPGADFELVQKEIPESRRMKYASKSKPAAFAMERSCGKRRLEFQCGRSQLFDVAVLRHGGKRLIAKLQQSSPRLSVCQFARLAVLKRRQAFVLKDRTTNSD